MNKHDTYDDFETASVLSQYGFPDMSGLLAGMPELDCSVETTSIDCDRLASTAGTVVPRSALLLNQMLMLQQEFQDAVQAEGQQQQQVQQQYQPIQQQQQPQQQHHSLGRISESPFINFSGSPLTYEPNPFESVQPAFSEDSTSCPDSPEGGLIGLGLSGPPMQNDSSQESSSSSSSDLGLGNGAQGAPYTFGQSIKQELFQAIPRSRFQGVKRPTASEFLGPAHSPLIGSPYFDQTTGWCSLPGTPRLQHHRTGSAHSGSLHSRNTSNSSLMSNVSTPISEFPSPFLAFPQAFSARQAAELSPFPLWSPLEEELLQASIDCYGSSDWERIAMHIPNRSAHECAERWHAKIAPARPVRARPNHNRTSSTSSIRSDGTLVAKGKWTKDEDEILRAGVEGFIASLGEPGLETLDESGKPVQVPWNAIASTIPGRNGIQCQARYSEALDPTVHKGKWSSEEDEALLAGMQRHDRCWIKIASMVPGRTQRQCRTRYMQLSGLADRSNRGVASGLITPPNLKRSAAVGAGAGAGTGAISRTKSSPSLATHADCEPRFSAALAGRERAGKIRLAG